MATPKKKQVSPVEGPKKVITGPAGFALLRLAKKAGVYDLYKEITRSGQGGAKKDSDMAWFELMFGISDRIPDCEAEFWDAASLVYDKGIDEVKEMDFEEVLSAVVVKIMDPGMISFFSKTQAVSGKQSES